MSSFLRYFNICYQKLSGTLDPFSLFNWSWISLSLKLSFPEFRSFTKLSPNSYYLFTAYNMLKCLLCSSHGPMYLSLYVIPRGTCLALSLAQVPQTLLVLEGSIPSATSHSDGDPGLGLHGAVVCILTHIDGGMGLEIMGVFLGGFEKGDFFLFEGHVSDRCSSIGPISLTPVIFQSSGCTFRTILEGSWLELL